MVRLPKHMYLSGPAIIQAIHRAVINKSYGGNGIADPSGFASIALPLQKRIQELIDSALQSSTRDDTIDWEDKVLNTIIASFVTSEDLGVSDDDVEYIVLLSTVVVMAYELVQVTIMEGTSTARFIISAFNEYLCEPEVCMQLAAKLEAEQRRLENACAHSTIQRAVMQLRKLMPDLLETTAVWKASMTQAQTTQNVLCDESSNSDGGVPDTVSKPVLSGAVFPRDLRIEVFLKHDCAWLFDFVESVDTCDGFTTIKTCIGLSMQVEPRFAVSEIYGIFNTVTITATNSCDKSLAGTIIVPPGYSFRVMEVEYVHEMVAIQGKTMIESDRAVLNVSNGDHIVQRRNCHRSVLIESTEC
ncbi:hypothetical protein EK21DRAFT_118947 [Setomelanomma holmii]|uniref:Uncharacterized protein n=1 Tax=Setomelanomma holmii TaxID=210430 RepID=A0A9P4GXC8_9PLEO|nr:hypothetical protein EK21DRAFT_118947 [Setomelanomma holmii]